MVELKAQTQNQSQTNMIKNLQAANLNGRTFGYELAPLTIITGDNAAGKSSIKDAITLCTLGHVPGYPKTNASIMENFASGASLTVAIQTAKGSFTRSWTRAAKTVKGDTSGDESIVASLAPALFSGEAFIAANSANRANMLRAAFPTLSDPKEAVRASVAKVNGPVDSKSIANLAFDEWVSAYLEELSDAAKGHRANVNRMKGLIQGMTQLDAETLASHVTKEELAAARAAVIKYAQNLGAAEQAVRAIVVPPAEAHPTESLETIKAKIKALTEKRNEIELALRAGNERASTDLALYNERARAYDSAMQRHAEAAQALANDEAAFMVLGVAATPLDYITQSASVAFDEAETVRSAEASKVRHDSAMRESDIADAELKSLEGNISDGCTCATCGAAKEYWKAEYLKLAANKIEVAKKKYEAALAVREEARVKAASDAFNLETLLVIMGCRKAALAVMESMVKLEANKKPEGPIPTLPAAFNAEALQSKIFDIENDLEDLNDAVASWARLEIFIAKTEAMQEAADALTLAQAAHAGAQAVIAELQASYDAGQAALEAEKKTAEAAKELEDAEKELARNEDAAEIVKATAAKESEKVLAPMLKVANIFTAGILSPPVTNVGLDIGRWHGTQWQPIARLSGAEKAMVSAAITAALATEGSKIVIVDEFSVIDDTWKPRFLANLRKAKEEGLINQAVILDNRAIEADGWEAIRLKK